MARARDPNRGKAFEIYKENAGNIDLVEIASQLNVSPGTVRGWKSKDSWDDQLNGTLRKNTERSKRKKEGKQKEKATVEKEVEQIIEAPDLTDKQRLFCLFYIRSFNATKAYQKAYQCNYEIAHVEGCKNLAKPSIKKEIQRLKQHRLNRELLDESDIFQKYVDIAFADITDYLEFGTEEVPVMALYGLVKVKDPDTGEEKELTKTVNTVRFRSSAEVDGTIVAEVKQGRDGASIKLADRMKALDWLAAHMDLATDEQRARIAQIKAQTERLSTQPVENEDDGVEIINDADEKTSQDIRDSNTEVSSGV